MEYKKYSNESYNLYTIKTDKFRTCQLEIVFRSKLEKSKITINNMLIDCLTYSSLKYPKRKNVVEKLEDLYNASLFGVDSRVGDMLFTNVIMTFLDPKYCDKNYLEEVIKLPFEMVFNPNIVNNEFDSKAFNIAKSRNRADILSGMETPSRYAILRSLYNMDKNSPSSINSAGYINDLESITQEDLYNYYIEFMKNNICDIYIIGNLDMEMINKNINELFRNRYVCDDISPEFINNKTKKKVIDVNEEGDYEQSSLILLYNTCNLNKKEQDYAIYLFNYIFGNGSLTTKLAKYLREENSLCYSTYSLYQKMDNLLIVYVGMDKKNKKLCIKLIDKALKEMCEGKFTEEDLDNGKKALLFSIDSSLDNQSSLLDNYLFNQVCKTPLLTVRKKEMMNVTKEEIIEVAKKIKLNTIYMLGGPDEKN